MRFTKVHGAGNDFIVLNSLEYPGLDYTKKATELCDRHTGIGADGLLIVEPSDKCDIKMRIINNDGSEAQMCGNGIRAFSKFVYARGIINKTSFSVETLSGAIKPELLFEGGRVTAVKVNMGKPVFDCSQIPVKGEGECLNRELVALNKAYTFSSVSTGVPHTAIKVDDPLKVELSVLGPAIEKHELFPQRTNVDFYRVVDESTLEMRVWERGAGPTLACGTGACAVAVIAMKNGEVKRSVDVQLELAALHIDWADDGNVYMTGPADIVFDGEYLG